MPAPRALAPPPPVPDLVASGWVLPAGVGRSGDPRWTLVGTVASPTATAVDPAGLVVGEGWSLDWWIGADDRWHLPAREAAVRQRLVDDAPVVETLVRIPGGDAIHRAYGFRAPRPGGDEWVAVEIENHTPVPFAVALVVRPFTADAVGTVGAISVEPVGGGRGQDTAHLVRVDGQPALVLPRRPARMATGNRADGDAAEVVTSARAGTELTTASCPDGLATMAVVFPLPHTATLRVVLPVGEWSDSGAVAFPAVVPDAATVAAGWEVHRRQPRVEVPDLRVAEAFERARAQVLLAHDGQAARRDGHRSPDRDPGTTEVLLGALDVLDRPGDVATTVAAWARGDGSPTLDDHVLLLQVSARHWLLHRGEAFLEALLPHVAAAVARLDRGLRRGRLTDPAAIGRAARALDATASMLAGAGQPKAGVAVAALADRMRSSREPLDPPATSGVDDLLASLSPTGAAAGPGPDGRRVGHDLAASAAVVLAVRGLLVAERADGLDLVPNLAPAWFGGGVELHDAPTTAGRLSFALRWHGRRPALLWDLEPHAGSGEVALRAPALDPAWSTTSVRGEALLAEVDLPPGVELVRAVAEHADIDPAMRRPAPEPPAPARVPTASPEGGTFS